LEIRKSVAALAPESDSLVWLPSFR
jgi:hypothetical protein